MIKIAQNQAVLGRSQSTTTNYTRCLAHMASHFGCCPHELDTEQIEEYLSKNHKN